MAINADKPHLWKADIVKSVDLYNRWFMEFAPVAYRNSRKRTAASVEGTLRVTSGLTDISAKLLQKHPEILASLRMSTIPPIAVDRLIGLAQVNGSLVKRMEKAQDKPTKIADSSLGDLERIANLVERMADPDIFVWVGRATPPTNDELSRAATVVADRLCGSVANPIIRNAQEERQLAYIGDWLTARGYKRLANGTPVRFDKLAPGDFAFHVNVPVTLDAALGSTVNVTVDAAIQPLSSSVGDFPLLIEAKSAGDFTNVNKRRKEEAAKMSQLRATYGVGVAYVLFLCGYFDTGYLGYEAAEGIDWVWEHRIDDLALFNL